MADQSRRTRKRLATRQSISDTATDLFFNKGFDHVTVDDIAAAADVGRMTVFKHFRRKEDMFFDREQDTHALAFAAIRDRGPGVSPIEATRLLAHRLVAERHPFVPLFEESFYYTETVTASDALKARARQMRDVFVRKLAEALAEAAGRDAGDPQAHLAAGLIAAVWSVAFLEAVDVFRADRSGTGSGAVFLSLVDQGMVGVAQALRRTPYADDPSTAPRRRQ